MDVHFEMIHIALEGIPEKFKLEKLAIKSNMKSIQEGIKKLEHERGKTEVKSS